MWHFSNGEGTILHNVIQFVGSFQSFVTIEPCQTHDFKQLLFSMKSLPHLFFYSKVEATPASSISICTCWGQFSTIPSAWQDYLTFVLILQPNCTFFCIHLTGIMPLTPAFPASDFHMAMKPVLKRLSSLSIKRCPSWHSNSQAI